MEKSILKNYLKIHGQILAAVGAGVAVLVIAVFFSLIIREGNLPSLAKIKPVLGSNLGKWALIFMVLQAFLSQSIFRKTLDWYDNTRTLFCFSVIVTMEGMVFIGFLVMFYFNFSIVKIKQAGVEIEQMGEKIFGVVLPFEKMIGISLFFFFLLLLVNTIMNGWLVMEERKEEIGLGE